MGKLKYLIYIFVISIASLLLVATFPSKDITKFVVKNNSEYFVELNVPLISFSSNNSNRDSNMLIHTEAFSYPEVIFKSTNIALNQNSAMVEGDLLFHGVTKKIKSTAVIDIANGFVAKGSFNINLRDYNVDPPTLMFIKINDIIKIEYFIRVN